MGILRILPSPIADYHYIPTTARYFGKKLIITSNQIEKKIVENRWKEVTESCPKKVQYGLDENAISWGFKKNIPPVLNREHEAGWNTQN